MVGVLAALALVVLPAQAGAHSSSAPVFHVLTPADGSTAVVVHQLGASGPYPVFSWRIDWDTPVDNTAIEVQFSADPGFGPTQTMESGGVCNAANINCYTSYQPRREWAYRPGTSTFYWRVGMIIDHANVWG